MRYSYVPGSDAAHTADIAPVPGPAAPGVLRAAQPYSLDTPGTPLGIRAVARAAEAGGWRYRATFALAEDVDGGIVASLALRLSSGETRRAWIAYVRTEAGGWSDNGAAILDLDDPVRPLRPIGIEPLKAMLRGEVWTPAPPAVVYAVPCPTCGKPAKLTNAGAIYGNHKCAAAQVEGRS